MTKLEFMSELESLLLDIPSDERIAALEFYEDYFEDAGPDNVENVIRDLGSPEKVAMIIKSDISKGNNRNEDDIIYTENGYRDMSVQEDRFEIARDADLSDNTKESDTKEKQYSNYKDEQKQNYKDGQQYDRDHKHEGNKTLRIILIIILCIFALPIIIPIGAVIFAFGVTGIAFVLSLLATCILCAIALLIGGAAMFIGGVIAMAEIPINGVFICGVGLFFFGLGILCSLISVKFCTKLMPEIFRGFIRLCQLPFRKRNRTVKEGH